MATTSAPRRVPLAVTALCLVQFMDVLGVTVVVTALPSMLTSLHASQAYSTLVATGYAMFFGGLLMLGARLGDRYGHRRTILASLAVFAAGSAITAAATSVVILTAGRCLQGAAAAASVPSALRLLTTITPAGSAAFTASVMTFVIGSTVITQPGGHLAGGLTLAACAVLAAAFAVIDRRAAAPLLPRPLLGSRKLRDGAAGSFLNTATTSSAVTLVTLYLQNTLHRSPLQAAAALIPFSLAVIAGSSLSAVAQRRQRPPLVVAEGLALIALADGVLIWSPGSAWAVPLCAAAAGAGIGLSSVAATGLGTDVGPRWRGGASGIVNTAAQLGTAVGVAVLLLVAAATSGVPAAGTGPPRVALAVAAVVAAAGAARFARPARADQAALG